MIDELSEIVGEIATATSEVRDYIASEYVRLSTTVTSSKRFRVSCCPTPRARRGDICWKNVFARSPVCPEHRLTRGRARSDASVAQFAVRRTLTHCPGSASTLTPLRTRLPPGHPTPTASGSPGESRLPTRPRPGLRGLSGATPRVPLITSSPSARCGFCSMCLLWPKPISEECTSIGLKTAPLYEPVVPGHHLTAKDPRSARRRQGLARMGHLRQKSDGRRGTWRVGREPRRRALEKRGARMGGAARREVCRPSLPARGNAPLQPLRRAALGLHRR